MSARLPVGVAAHHPATAQVGATVLRAGGTAADAAIAATLAACVAETVLTGLAGGGFAVHWDAAAARAEALDFFVDVPRGAATAEPTVADIDFGSQSVPYTIGPTSVAVPGVVPGLGALWERYGTWEWADLVAPAAELARRGVPMPEQHAAVLAMIASVLTLGRGADMYAPGGRLLTTGDILHHPGLATALRLVAEEGPTTYTTGSLARATAELMALLGGGLTAADLAAYEPRWSEPGALLRHGHRLLVRNDFADLRGLVAAMDAAHANDPGRRAVALARALRGHLRTGTTNVTVVDAAGNACVVSSSLGLGSGDYLPGLDLHLNSMLGEIDLIVDGRQGGHRVGSNMVPLLVVDDDGLVAAGGGAGGSRIPTAMIQCLLPVVDDGVPPQQAIDAPRWHPLDGLVHHEPGVDTAVLDALAGAGFTANPWPRRHYYFGGINLITRGGAGCDPRRSGAVAMIADADLRH